ncbi:tyrosine protein phosphatase [Paenibacillus sp. H1-7]|uniref:tyrosine-protein phosphatase n=1 Tax=Paenibacillus sp. H1-7 TaxID=2282849 RepID=UPI001EF7A3B5|nr:CpsB/CapC family capsule biosynthesis tyrosine phosphatase [Paenibacillus sp. H1-7]ULL19408.1 tyrosine protein phosphatase [Paenibacillus sp. H1-7]
MIDIHSHILPGVDDGAEDMEETVLMAQAAVEEGIHTLIATPHHANGKYDNPMEKVERSVREVNRVLEQQNIPLTILPGQEIRLYSDLPEDLHQQVARTLHSSRYILIEFPSREIPKQTDELFHELRVMGLVPVIAHPERNMEIAQDPMKLQRIIQQGALSQVTTHSLNGLFGKSIQKLSLDMCKQHLVHFVSSDAHNMSHRAFGLRQAYAFIGNTLGDQQVRYYQANAARLIANEDISVLQPDWRKRAWWRFW